MIHLLSPLYQVNLSVGASEEKSAVTATSTKDAKVFLQGYLVTNQGYSKQKLIERLIEETFSTDTALMVVEETPIDFEHQAFLAAERIIPQQSALDSSKIIDRLVHDEGFTPAEAHAGFTQVDLEKLAFERAKSFFRYGDIPSQDELINDLQTFGYPENITNKVANQVYSEYEAEKKIALESSEHLLTTGYYSREKLLDEMAATHNFDYPIVLGRTVDSLEIDWAQQALSQAEAFLDRTSELTHRELSEQLAIEQYSQKNIHFALQNLVKVTTSAEVHDAVTQLEEAKTKENLVFAQYALAQLPASNEKNQLQARVERVIDHRKNLALDQAKEVLEKSNQSRAYLIQTLIYEGFTREEAVYAVDSLDINWETQATMLLKSYLASTPDSKVGATAYLREFWEFADEEIDYALTQTARN